MQPNHVLKPMYYYVVRRLKGQRAGEPELVSCFGSDDPLEARPYPTELVSGPHNLKDGMSAYSDELIRWGKERHS